MAFLIVIGILLVVVCLIVRKKLEWNVSDNETCPQAKQDVKNNRIAWKVMMIIGVAALIIGLIGVIL